MTDWTEVRAQHLALRLNDTALQLVDPHGHDVLITLAAERWPSLRTAVRALGAILDYRPHRLSDAALWGLFREADELTTRIEALRGVYPAARWYRAYGRAVVRAHRRWDAITWAANNQKE